MTSADPIYQLRVRLIELKDVDGRRWVAGGLCDAVNLRIQRMDKSLDEMSSILGVQPVLPSERGQTLITAAVTGQMDVMMARGV
ncbi:hypothetical protein SAMN05216276_1001288 [Streptosporangium subroseum]|uniref:Uncharacterized protein n=1 Tax=Streptosporangium subroseum TaxID=106412 RepID=A0A239AC78_9ACTN|nr:hypothetical protein [Streptosporangium subroseum]SNR93159.1 hypothetical protein SAMN05216276_1001288 [Streptosporangium subroseum]